MSVDGQGLNPHPVGTPEHTEWQEITHAPAWHGRSPETRRVHLAVAAEDRPGRTSLAINPVDADAARLAASGVIFGPDVSQYQGKPNWYSVRTAGYRFAFYKATEGRTFVDASCAHNKAGIPAAGLIAGAYHFLYYSDEYARNPALWGAQAEWFARNVPAAHGHVLDVEAPATAGHWLGVREWVREYRRLFPGHPLGGYSNRSLWRNRSRMPYDPRDLFDYFWHAGYRDGLYISAHGSIPAQWAAVSSLSNSVAGMGYPEVRLWQITDHAAVPGIAGTCDGNAFQGSAADLAALITKKGTVDDHMSAEDVAKIMAYLGSQEFKDEIASAVHNTPIGRLKDDDGSPVTLGQVASGIWKALPAVDELSPAAVQAVVSGVAAARSGPAASSPPVPDETGDPPGGE